MWTSWIENPPRAHREGSIFKDGMRLLKRVRNPNRLLGCTFSDCARLHNAVPSDNDGRLIDAFFGLTSLMVCGLSENHLAEILPFAGLGCGVYASSPD
jgi:hypothetical protein